jgi:hypothetical protein
LEVQEVRVKFVELPKKLKVVGCNIFKKVEGILIIE